MASSDELRAALAVAELEEQLAAAKDAGDTGGDDYALLKQALRDARQTYRAMRAGEGTANPETVAAKVRA